ncbi:MAG: hypothetical protein ACQEP1_04440 [Nanobdellota archaeon]
MNLAEKAYRALYPEKEPVYSFELKYSGKFSPYNGNIRKKGRKIFVSLSREWEDVSSEIQKGIIQNLYNRLFRTKRKTDNIDLYDSFLKRVHVAVKKEKPERRLLDSFNRIRDKYLDIDMPNIKWGNRTYRKLGSYEYGKDLILISSVLKDAPDQYIDFVMYHELLHKKHKFSSSGNRSVHHSPAFRKEEGRFEDKERVDRDLNSFVKKKRFFRPFRIS